MRAAERLEARCRDDTVDDLQLEAHPNVQCSILGLARHETGHATLQFPRPPRRREVPLNGRAVFHRRVNSLAEKGQAEHHAGARRASDRRSATAFATRRAAAMTSSSDVKRPTLKRSELAASTSLKPIPVSTCEASGLSAAQAEPADTQTSPSA